MRPLVAICLLALIAPVFGGEKATFKTAKLPKIGESSAFELSKANRAILKIADQGYIVLDLLESSREDGGRTFTEACSISWTLITPSTIKGKTVSAFIRYRTAEAEKDSVTVTTIGGSDEIEVGSLSIRWSYGSPDSIFFYPSPGTEYATIKIEQDSATKPEPAVELKSGGS